MYDVSQLLVSTHSGGLEREFCRGVLYGIVRAVLGCKPDYGPSVIRCYHLYY